MKIGTIVQARTSSTRLPGKVLKELPPESGITVLEHVIRRLRHSKKSEDLIIATTTGKEDDAICDIAKKEKVACFRGSKEDVLARFYHAAVENKIDIVVRITSDCPCVDATVVDAVINGYLKSETDYASNALKRTYPHGFDTEVFSFHALEESYRNARDPYDREHVTPYIYRNPDIFKVLSLEAPPELFAPKIRLALDWQEDYHLLCRVFGYLYPVNNNFGIRDLIKLFKHKPWLGSINRKVAEKV